MIGHAMMLISPKYAAVYITYHLISNLFRHYAASYNLLICMIRTLRVQGIKIIKSFLDISMIRHQYNNPSKPFLSLFTKIVT
jgi:hypothetical protein